MRILMVAAESNPFYKTGGLADVVYSLSKKMTVYKHRVFVAIPFYKKMKIPAREHSFIKLDEFDVPMCKSLKKCIVYQLDYEKITFILIKNEFYFDRDEIYGYQDDEERFAFFNNAVVEYISRFKGGFDVIHVHDWHSAMVPYLFKTKIKSKFTRQPKFVLTIHNPAFMGYVKSYDAVSYFSLREIEKKYINNNMDISCLKMGISNADYVTTVSPTHAKELIKNAKLYNLDDVLLPLGDRFEGILNGVDVKEFNPDKDKKICISYNKENVISHKIINKKFLMSRFRMQGYEKPLVGCVSRITTQKGIDLIIQCMDDMIHMDMNFVFLGKGDKVIEERLLNFQKKYPSSVVVVCDYSDSLAHQIYASCDFFAMPSQFEPCGISQMIALRYGTIPLVREVGGLKDTVIPYNGINEDVATGFTFYEYSSKALLSTLRFAKDLYEHKRAFSHIVHNAMDQDYSWTNSYFKYIEIYEKICSGK